MGASESKLTFKQGIFKLQDSARIAPDDLYWSGFWELPESTEDVFTLFSSNDIRRTRDASLPNLETLIGAVTGRLFFLKANPEFPHSELAPEKEVLNCLRVLTRILPYIYEAENLEAWEEKFFWEPRTAKPTGGQRQSEVLFDESNESDQSDEKKSVVEQQGKPLAEELLDTLVDLLFFSGFTIPINERTKSKVTYAIWTSGVGCQAPVPTNVRLENNRTEVLRLLLTMTSKSMYMPAHILPIKGVKAITYLATCPDKQVVLSTLCSLLNTTIKFNPQSWRLPYDHVVVGDPKHIYIASCLQFLLVLLLYPIPEEGDSKSHPRKNYFRHFLGRLHRPEDFQFICDGMSRTLHQPLTANSSYLPGSQKPVRWASEMIMLFWETIQCNKRFRSFVVDTERGHDFVILILYYAIENRLDSTKQGLVRMCIFVLQTLSVEESFGSRLNQPFKNQETLPSAMRIDNWSGTYGDFLIVSIHTLITGSKGRLDSSYPALLAIINNVAAYLEKLSPLSCLKLMQLYASISSPSFLLANETNHSLLTSLLDAFNAIIEHKYDENTRFLMAVVKYRTRFEALRTFTLESGQEEIERLRQQQKELGNAAEHRIPSGNADSLRSPTTPTLSNVPEEDGAFAIGDDDDDDTDTEDNTPMDPSSRASGHRSSRTPSIASSVDSTLPTQVRGMSEKARGKMPVGTPTFSRVNSMGSISSQQIPHTPGLFNPSPQWIDTWLPALPLHTILTLLSNSDDKPPVERPTAIEPTLPRAQTFEWTPLSLGWYESLLWSFICASEMIMERGTAGVWNGTAIRLFKVEKDIQRGPSLMKPKGAVDAVGSSIVQRIGSLHLRGSNTTAGGSEAIPSPRGDGGGNIRDV